MKAQYLATLGLMLMPFATATSAQTQITQLQTDRLAFTCNTASNFTNLRSSPTANGSSIRGQLPNGVPIQIKSVVTNNAGFDYYRVHLRDNPESGARAGYIYHENVLETCDIPAAITPSIEDLAGRLAKANFGIDPNHISDLNANYDGTQLFLVNLPDLTDISPLANESSLTFIDFTASGIADLAPLANLFGVSR